jgi:uncharacterized membrane protein YgcG
MRMRNLIFDDIGILSEQETEKLRMVIVSLNKDLPGVEIGVKIIDSNRGEDPHSAGVREYNRICLGQSGVNNGVLIVFAMGDRHVELIPGIRYNSLLNRLEATGLLKETVVPLMQVGMPGEAVVAAAGAVALRIRGFEASFGKIAKRSGVTGMLGGGNDSESFSAQRQRAFKILNEEENPLRINSFWIFIASFAIAVIFTAYLLSNHLCPQCHGWMSISEREIVSPTYTSRGRGMRVKDCQKCNYHREIEHSIAPKSDRTSNDNWNTWGGSGGGSGGGGGGAADGGGGGGADW